MFKLVILISLLMVYIIAQEDLTDLALGVHWIFMRILNLVFFLYLKHLSLYSDIFIVT